MTATHPSTTDPDEARFGFGKNWQNFLKTVNEDRVQQSKLGLSTLLECENLSGKSFLDIGSGSGLSSLAAKKLDAAQVTSFDYDTNSVACTEQIKKKFYADDDQWIVEQGSALDPEYLESLGKFDVVYSWGVLHHTGDMWPALENALIPLKPNGHLVVAIYNDQGFKSKIWTKIKALFNKGLIGRSLVRLICYPYFMARYLFSGFIKHFNPFYHFINKKNKRGMSVFHDWEDWIGGYPFEVATPEAIFKFYYDKGLELVNMTTTNGLGCNEFVFQNRSST